MQFFFVMQVNHNSWMCRSFQANRDKLSMIRKRAAEQTLSYVSAMCKILLYDFHLVRCKITDIQMHTWIYVFLCALAMWIISSFMLAIKNLYVHTNHLTDQPSVDCMHFHFITASALYFECTANWKQFVCACAYSRECMTFSDNSKRQFEDNVMSSRLLIIFNWIAHSRQINNWLCCCDENAYALSPLFG